MRYVASLSLSWRTDRTIQRIVRRFRSAGVVASVVASSACYATVVQPTTVSLVEHRAEFLITDEGRVALRAQIGPGAGKVEGRVVLQDDSAWTVRVYRLTTISDESYAWMGESVRIPMRAVYSVSRRDFDRRATVLAAASVTGAVAAFMWSRGLFGGGIEVTGPPIPPVGENLRR